MIYFLMVIIDLGSWVFPWWWLVVPCFFGGFKSNSIWLAMGLGFASVFCVWGPITYFFDLQNHGLMSLRLAGMLQFPTPFLIYIFVGALGGIVGASAAVSGFYWRLRPQPVVD